MRPSELLGIQGSSDAFAAYCLDSACGEFGAAVEGALQDVEGKNKKEIEVKMERVLRKWLDLPAKFRDPMRAGVAPRPTQGEEE